jgi:N-methylhydantoinase B/oxoprolinase/acetone carboxylase alpha subunit
VSDRALVLPYGVPGDVRARCTVLSVDTVGGANVDFATPSEATFHPVYRDEVVIMRSPGGSGRGDPQDRPADKDLRMFGQATSRLPALGTATA